MTSNTKLPLQIKNYLDFLGKVETSSDRILTKEMVDKNLEKYGNMINTFLVYPDLFVDLLSPKKSSFSLYFVQRIVLRAMARHRQSYHTFTRAFSKSFLAFLSRYIFTMLMPRHYSFVVSGTKQQAAAIAREKVVMDLWMKFPLLQEEMKKTRVGGKLVEAYVSGKDYAEFRFTHGGRLDVVGTGSSTRGGRRHSGIFEEVIELNPTEINEVILPLMNKQRETALGAINPNEPHSSKIFVTTAGYKGTYAYEKLIETVCYAVIDPKRYMVLGGSYEIPLMHGLLDPDQMMETLTSPSYERDSIDREYRSIWSGTMKGAAFGNTEVGDLRKIVRAEHAARKPAEGQDFFYIVSADMAKDGSANTVAVVLKVYRRQHSFMFAAVNMYEIQSTNYEVVSAELKRIIAAFEAKLFVYDANGIGAALRDWLNKEQFDPVSNRLLPAYGIINPPAKSKNDILKTSRDKTIGYEVKASGSTNGHINRIFFSKMGSRNIRFLLPKDKALKKLKETKKFVTASTAKQKEYLSPYLRTDKMEEELRNLDVKDVSDQSNPNNLTVMRRNKKIQKDYYSAIAYGIYATHLEIEVPYYAKKSRKGKSMSDYIMGF